MGYVYVLENDYFKKDILKIGQTYKNPEERATELSKETGIPMPFKVKAKYPTEYYQELEKFLHEKLSEKRINPSREFFYTDLYTIDKLVEQFNVNNYNIKPKKIKKILENQLVDIYNHNYDNYPNKQSLVDFFLKRIIEENSTYHFKGNRKAKEGTIIWIKYEKEIIGEFTIKRGVKIVDTNGEYNKQILIEPSSLRFYAFPISYNDYVTFENNGIMSGPTQKASYEVYFNLTKHLYEEKNFIQARINRNKNFNSVNFENEVIYFLSNILLEKSEKIFMANEYLAEKYSKNICFSIYENIDNILCWNLAIHNINDKKDYKKLKSTVEKFSNINNNVLKNFEEIVLNFESENFFPIIKDQIICDSSNLSIDEIIIEIDKALKKILEISEKI